MVELIIADVPDKRWWFGELWLPAVRVVGAGAVEEDLGTLASEPPQSTGQIELVYEFPTSFEVQRRSFSNVSDGDDRGSREGVSEPEREVGVIHRDGHSAGS